MRRATIPRWPQIDPQAQNMCSTTNLAWLYQENSHIDTQIYIFHFRIVSLGFSHFCRFWILDQMAWSFDVSSTHNTHTHPNDHYFPLVNQAAVQRHKIPVSSVQKVDRRDYRLASKESTHTTRKKQLKHAHNSRNRSNKHGWVPEFLFGNVVKMYLILKMNKSKKTSGQLCNIIQGNLPNIHLLLIQASQGRISLESWHATGLDNMQLVGWWQPYRCVGVNWATSSNRKKKTGMITSLT